MVEERGLEGLDPPLFVRVLAGLDLLVEIGMRAQCPLREGDERAREDVGALHRDRYRHHLVGGLQVVGRSVAHALAAVQVHGVVERAAHALGGLVLHDGGDHGGLLAAAHHRRGDRPRRLVDIGILHHARERLLEPLHPADGEVELLPDARIGTGIAQERLGSGRGGGGQRDGAARGEAFHQHAPALAYHLLPADHPVDRDEHVPAPVGAVGERDARGEMAPADLHAGMIGGNHGDGDPAILAMAQDVVGVEHPERQADEGGVGPERDVALLPREADADHLPALVHAPRHVADIAHGGRIGPRCGPGEGEAGDLDALRQARQVVLLLLGRAVFLDELAGAQRVRDHDDGAHVGRARGDAPQDERLRLGREAQAPVLLGNEHAEESVLLDEIPDLRGDLLLVVPDGPVLDHAAQLVGRPIQEGLLLLGKCNGRDRAQLLPVRLAGEQLGVEADGAGVQGLLLRCRDPGQNALDLAVEGPDQHRAPERRCAQCPQDGDQGPGDEDDRPGRERAELKAQHAGLPEEQRRSGAGSPSPQRRPVHGQRERSNDADDDKHQLGHDHSLPCSGESRPDITLNSACQINSKLTLT